MNEAWSLQRRRKQGLLMKRRAKIIARVRKRKLSRMADAKALKRRAQKAARAVLFKRMAAGKTKGEITSKQMLIAIAAKLDKNQAKINKLAVKMLPKVKKKEMERLTKLRKNQSN